MNDKIITVLKKEMDFASDKFGNFHNSHELSSVLREEVEEYWEHVRFDTGNTPHALYELCQVASVALRYVLENCRDLTVIEKIQLRRHERDL